MQIARLANVREHTKNRKSFITQYLCCGLKVKVKVKVKVKLKVKVTKAQHVSIVKFEQTVETNLDCLARHSWKDSKSFEYAHCLGNKHKRVNIVSVHC